MIRDAIWPLDPETEIDVPGPGRRRPDEVASDPRGGASGSARAVAGGPRICRARRTSRLSDERTAGFASACSILRLDVSRPGCAAEPVRLPVDGAASRLDVAVEQQAGARIRHCPRGDRRPSLEAEHRQRMIRARPPNAARCADRGTLPQVPVEVAAPERDEDELREIEAGLAKFKRVVQLNPRNAHAWDALGNLYKSGGQYKEALLAYQQAISNDPSKALYHHHLALVYACEGRMEDAIDALQRVIEIDPDHGLAHAALGGYYRKMGLEELAQKHVGKAMKSIFDSENEYNRACLAAICGDTDQALRAAAGGAPEQADLRGLDSARPRSRFHPAGSHGSSS